jgi:hypothetical protein
MPRISFNIKLNFIIYEISRDYMHNYLEINFTFCEKNLHNLLVIIIVLFTMFKRMYKGEKFL